MAQDTDDFYLVRKLPGYLERLEREYSATGNEVYREIVRNSRSVAIACTDFDSYAGGTCGHDARLYLPLDILASIPLRNINKVAEGICNDLNELARSVQNEFFRAVVLEAEDENDPYFQKSTPFSTRLTVNPNTLTFWKPGHIRLFISHRDEHKQNANELAEALEAYGISSFVGHDTIKPLTEWRHEIITGLETMEIMLVYLTNDFEDSVWTQQEIGYALGKGTPIITLKLESKDPPGFISHIQAQVGSKYDCISAAGALYKLICDRLGAAERLQDGLIAAFIASDDFNQTRYRFDRMAANVEKLSAAQLETIVNAYRNNRYLHDAIYLNNKYSRLVTYLARATGADYELVGVSIRPAKVPDANDDLPF